MKMTTRKINRLIIKKDGKVYSFRCSAGGGAIYLRDSDFVYIVFVADLLSDTNEIIISGYTSGGRSSNLHLTKLDVTKLSRSIIHFFGHSNHHIRSFCVYNDLDNPLINIRN